MSDHHPQIERSEFSVEDWHEGLEMRPKQDPKGSSVDHHTRQLGPVTWSFPLRFFKSSKPGTIRYSGVEPEYLGFDKDEDEVHVVFLLHPGTIVIIEEFVKAHEGRKRHVYRQVLDIREMRIEPIDSMLENLLQGPAPRLMQSLSSLIHLPKQKQLEEGERRPGKSPGGKDPHGD